MRKKLYHFIVLKTMHLLIALKNIQPIFINLTDAYFRTQISPKQTNLCGEKPFTKCVITMHSK